MYIGPFHSENFKKIIRDDPELWGCAIFRPKMTHLSWMNFFGTNHYYYLHLPIGPFHYAKFKKILIVDLELWRCTIFGPKMVHYPKFFFGKLLISVSSTFNPFHCAKFFQRNQHYEDVQFLGPKWLISINENIFYKTC